MSIAAGEGRGRAQSPQVTMVLVILHAVLFASAFPGVGAWPAAFLALVPLAWAALRARSLRFAAGVTLVVHLGLWLWLERWIAGVTAIGFPLEVLYLALWAPTFVLVLGRIGRYRRSRAWPMVLLLPIVWTALEVIRGELIFHGYPWYLLGHPLVEWPPLVQIAEWTGAYGASFLAAMCAGAVVDVLRAARAPWPGWTPRRAAGSALLTAVVGAGTVGFGLWRLAALDRDVPLRTLTVIGLQTNLPQSNKIGWPIEQQRRDVAAFVAATRRAWDETGGADLVVWPETMLPVRGLDPETLETLARYGQQDEIDFASTVIALAHDLGIPLLIGAPSYHGLRVEEDATTPGRARWVWDRHHNSAYLVGRALPFPRYDKVHLTPFGEEIPYIAAWPWLEQRLSALAAGGMTLTLDAASEVSRIVVPSGRSTDVEAQGGDGGAERAGGERGFTLGTPICFEDSMGRVCRRMIYGGGGKQADALINLSNDGWYGAHDAGRIHHAQIARFRAIENRVPVLRCVNTGNSVAIDAGGNVVARIGDGRYGGGRRDGWIRAELAACAWVTVFGRVGNAFGWLCVLAAGAAFLQTLHRPRLGWDSTT